MSASPEEMCNLSGFKGWRCTRKAHTSGPCALVPKWWNIADKWLNWKNVSR